MAIIGGIGLDRQARWQHHRNRHVRRNRWGIVRSGHHDRNFIEDAELRVIRREAEHVGPRHGEFHPGLWLVGILKPRADGAAHLAPDRDYAGMGGQPVVVDAIGAVERGEAGGGNG